MVALLATTIIIIGALSIFRHLETNYQHRIEQVTQTLQKENVDQKAILEKQLKHIQTDNETLKKQNADLQKQVSIKKQQQAALAAAAVSNSQAAQSGSGARVASSGNCAAYTGLLAQYDWNVSIAAAVMQAESGCNPSASSPTCDHGLMQINCVHAAAVGGNLALLDDPATNVRVAYQVYSGAGWSAWTTFTSGAYLRYLS